MINFCIRSKYHEEERDLMSKRVKLLILITCTAAAALFGLFAYFSAKGPAVLASRLPLPSGSAPYVVFETEENYYPVSISALLSEGSMLCSGKDPPGTGSFPLLKQQKNVLCLLKTETKASSTSML